MRLGSMSASAGVLMGHVLLAFPAMAQAVPPAAAPSSSVPADVLSDPQILLQQSVSDMQRMALAGNRSEALKIAERTYERLRTEAGPEHPLTAVALFNVGAAQRQTGAVEDAVVTLQRAVALEMKLGPASRQSFRRALRELAEVERGRGQAEAAIVIYDAVLVKVRQDGAGSIAEAELLEEQAQLHRHVGAFPPAEENLKRALAIKQARLLPSDPGLVTTLTHLGGVARLVGRHEEAEGYYKRAIDIVAAGKGEKDPNLGILVDNLGVLYQSLGRDAEAEVQHKRALAILEDTLGREHLSTGQCAANLGAVMFKQGRNAEAERLIDRALAIYRRTLPPGDWRIGIVLDNLAGVWRNQRRYGEAAQAYAQAIEILRKAYSDTHPDVGTALNNLALMHAETGRFSDAEREVTEALRIAEKAHGSGHVNVALVLNTMGYVQSLQGKRTDARASYSRAIDIVEKALGTEHPLLVGSATALGEVQLADGDAAGALASYQRAASISVKRRGRPARSSRPIGRAGVDPFVGMVAARWQLETTDRGKPNAQKGSAKSASAAEEALADAQLALQSEAGRTIAQLGARLGARIPALAALARERQDLVEEWGKTDGALTAVLGKPADGRRQGDDAPFRRRLVEIDARLDQIDALLAKDHAGFLELAMPRAVPAKELKALLRADEVLLAILPAASHVYVWLVTRNDVRWHRVELSEADLDRKVRTLRCGLDAAEWWEETRAKRCAELTGRSPTGDVLPFDSMASVELYRALIEPFAAQIEGRQLLIAAGGALSSLPLQVLMPEVPKDGALAKARWLGLRHPMTTLPSIASLKTLRRDARASNAQRPYLGVGNPLLIGPNRDYSAAWGAQSCLASQLKRRTGSQPASMADARSRGGLVRGSVVDVEQVRLLSPLPETRDELCSVSASAGASEQDLVMGSKATEKQLRDLNASGALRSFRIVHFATHGLIAGEVPGLTEGALVMTPPAEAKGDEDGLLTASEIATFRLDADWVILSACNTAAGDTLGAETFSGLARAFFHAGARSLLVSHWPVQSAAAVKLTSRALAEIRRSPGLSRAEALRRSMAALVSDAADPNNAHPQTWAPFVVAGEGGGSTAATVPAASAAGPAASSAQPVNAVVPAAAAGIGATTAAGAAAASQKPWVPPWLKQPSKPAAGPASSKAPAQGPAPKVAAPGPAATNPAPAKSPTTIPSPAKASQAPVPLVPSPQSVTPAPSPAPAFKSQPSLTDSLFR
jgi:CHAT domain-containing protein/Tfp pilus assembly protein PilF